VAATPQERLALGVAALLLAAGAVARTVGGADEASALAGAPAAEAAAGALAAEVRDSVARAARRREPLAPGERLDPNTATADELDRLPRVGPALAARIAEWREARGPFRTLGDLDAVPGVGPALLREISPHVALPPSANAAPVADWGRAAAAEGGVDLNRATAAELQALPGIGPALAERIVASRAAEGPFRTVDDLLRVAGIGPAKLERLRSAARVTP
jgi:competence ComEA-like helix-hairpin-helix protein